MSAAQALALEQFLAGQGFVRRSLGEGGLLSGAGAKLSRASDLPSLLDRRERLTTSAPALDRLLEGGLARGALVELSARARSCGRFAAGLSALAAATSSGLASALVDVGGHLDPQGAEEAGVDLTLLLWARPRRIRQALAAAETLLSAGFPLVVFDLGLSTRGLRFVPDAAWVRLARAAESQNAALLVLSPVRSSGVAAQSAVSAGAARPLWLGSGREPRLLAGLSSRLTLEKDPRARSGLTEQFSLRAPEALGPLELLSLRLRDPHDSRRIEITALDLPEHFVDVGSGEGMLRSDPDDPKLPTHIATQGAPNSPGNFASEYSKSATHGK